MVQEYFNGNDAAENILSAIKETGQKFGVSYIASILVGSNSQKIINYTHNEAPSYGVLQSYSLAQVKAWIRELVKAGDLAQSGEKYPVLKLTEQAGQGSLSAPDEKLAYKGAVKGESAEVTLALYKAGKTIKEISRERGLAYGTILSHLATAFAEGEKIDINQFVSTEKQATISEQFKKLGMEFLSPVKQALGPAYTWEDLKLVRAKMVRQSVSV